MNENMVNAVTSIEIRFTRKKEEQVADIRVDTEDANWVCQWDWRLDKDGYVVRGQRVNGKYTTFRLHREIMKRHGSLKEDGTKWVVDHRNNDKLNNCKDNLRVCKQSDNNKNRRSKKGKLKGITRVRNGWKVTVTVNKKPIYIGTFPNVRMAQYFYNQAAAQLHGDFANLPSESIKEIEEAKK